MSVQKEMQRIKKTNLEHKAKSLRVDIEALAQTISINLDCSLHRPEDLPMSETDSQFDELKSKWAELNTTLVEISRIEKELS